jgi:hypothetical protein
MTPNYWSVICPETVAPGTWKTWLSEKCVAIGWPPSHNHLEGPTDKPGWDIARARAQKIAPGDIIIPYLLKYRFGRPGEVVKVAISDAEWRPTVPKGEYHRHPEEAQLGRRIEVKWIETGVPPLDKVTVVPPDKRRSGGEVKQTVVTLQPDRYQTYIGMIASPANWKLYAPLEAQSTDETNDEQTESLDDPEPSKLAIQETLFRSILAKNLHKIESGLQKHPDFPKLEEVVFDLGRLDLLCIDSQKRLTIIELQLGDLDDGHIGKISRYYGWFASKYGNDVRALLLFEYASPDILEAYKKSLPWLELRKFAFNADMKVEKSFEFADVLA